MNKSLLLLLLVVVGVIYGADTDPVILEGVLRDQSDHRMTECGYDGACCGSAGAANSSYGWVGTDFQLPLNYYKNDEKGLVGRECNATFGYQGCGRIGLDRTPVYAYPGISPGKNIGGPKTFYNWFHNSEQTRNVPFNLTLPYKGSGLYAYENITFFPLDGLGWKDTCPNGAKVLHNYGYCWETHFRFGYTGGEKFDFIGDDDVWAYINDILVIDLGSLHQKLSKSIQLDVLAPFIGLQKASKTNPDASYLFDFFYCERHTTESNMAITTSLAGYCSYDDWCGVCEGNGLSCCTDEVIQTYCDDSNACTFDTCVPQYNPKIDRVRGCKHVPTVNCTTTDICNPAQCDAGSGKCKTSPLNCDDNDPCTFDKCISTSGCVHTRNLCDDKNVCTTDSCNPTNGACINTPKPPCNDNDACTSDRCDPAVECVYTQISCPVSTCFPFQCFRDVGCRNSTLNCDDKTVCTDDSCVEGSGCAHRPINCDDRKACTDDSCDPVNGCLHKDNSARCNDNNVCTNDGCDNTTNCYNQPLICLKKNCFIESCVAPSQGCTYLPKPCDDRNACTLDSCDLTSGQCVNLIQDCKAGNDCRADSCDTTRGCTNSSISCDDKNVCTDDICLAKGGCQHLDNSARCNDNNACTKDACDPIAGCVYQNISSTCDDKDPCTDDVCIPASGCRNTKKDCNTNAPTCQTGVCGADGSCVYTVIPNCSKCQTPVVIDCKSNVTNKCFPWRCDPNSVQCVRDPDVVCNDNNNCTIDSCIPGTGLCNFTTKNCDDSNPCTLDSCDRVKGCINTPKSCDDKNVCTNDSCVAGECKFTPIPPSTCDDGLACTDDVCIPATGCSSTNKTCNDNNPCTTDSCSTIDGQCVFTSIPGQCLPCGTGRCTWTDSCNPQICDNTTNTCKTMPATCNDRSTCTNDACIGTGPAYSCNYTTLPCDPIDPCHTALCDAINGCVQKIIPCDDKNPCTLDSCVVNGTKGICVNKPVDCLFTDLCSPQKCNTTTGQCQVFPTICTDGNLCTRDVCAINGSCIFPPIDCNTDPCNPGQCNATTGACDKVVIDCNDGNQCTTDSAVCDPSSTLGPQCVHTTNATVCNDGKSCTNDYCNSTIAIGENPCQFTPVVCPDPDACSDNITCVEGKGCVPTPKACALNNTDVNTTDYCNFHKCDKNAGCIFTPRICPNQDVSCFTVTCDNIKQCQQVRRSDFGRSTSGGIACALLYDPKTRTAAITAGALAGIIIGSVAAAALIGAGGKAGYDFLMAKNNPMGPVATNPLYAQSAASGNNQLYAG